MGRVPSRPLLAPSGDMEEPAIHPMCRPGPVAVSSLTKASLVRSAVDPDHVARLSEVLQDCPPITLTDGGALLDGLHRLEAARSLGWESIPAVIVPVASPVNALLTAAAANSTHGLPLTREERRSAVHQLLRLDLSLSDRRIARACGVSRSVVESARAAVRECSGGRNGHVNTRIGADGKRYPGTRRAGLAPVAAAVLRLRPQTTVRELAGLLGVSTGIAHRLHTETRERLRRESRWTRFWHRLIARWRLRCQRIAV